MHIFSRKTNASSILYIVKVNFQIWASFVAIKLQVLCTPWKTRLFLIFVEEELENVCINYQITLNYPNSWCSFVFIYYPNQLCFILFFVPFEECLNSSFSEWTFLKFEDFLFAVKSIIRWCNRVNKFLVSGAKLFNGISWLLGVIYSWVLTKFRPMNMLKGSLLLALSLGRFIASCNSNKTMYTIEICRRQQNNQP